MVQQYFCNDWIFLVQICTSGSIKSTDACRTIDIANVVRLTDGEVFAFGKRLVFKHEDRVTRFQDLFLVP